MPSLKSVKGNDDVVFANSYESHSGLETFGKAFGVPPGVGKTSDFIAQI